MLPRFSGSADIKMLLAAADDRSVFDRAFNGLCGAAVQAVLFQECMALLRSAVDDLPNITVDSTTSKAEDGRRLFTGLAVAGNRSWTAHEASLCHLTARHLDQPAFRNAFLELLDLTEWSLRVAVDAGAATVESKTQSNTDRPADRATPPATPRPGSRGLPRGPAGTRPARRPPAG